MITANNIFKRYVEELEGLSRGSKKNAAIKRLELEGQCEKLGDWNFFFFTKLGMENDLCTYCGSRYLRGKFTEKFLYNKNFLWDLSWFKNTEKRDNAVLTLEQELSESPSNENQDYEWDFTKITVATTQKCGVFIGQCPPRSWDKAEEIINKLNNYYKTYGKNGKKPAVLIILLKLQTKNRIQRLTVCGWKLQKQGMAKLLPPKDRIFEFNGKL